MVADKDEPAEVVVALALGLGLGVLILAMDLARWIEVGEALGLVGFCCSFSRDVFLGETPTNKGEH